jgi:hypothetical protein
MTHNEAFATLATDLEKAVFVAYGQWQGAEGETHSKACFLGLCRAEEELLDAGGDPEAVKDLARNATLASHGL